MPSSSSDTTAARQWHSKVGEEDKTRHFRWQSRYPPFPPSPLRDALNMPLPWGVGRREGASFQSRRRRGSEPKPRLPLACHLSRWKRGRGQGCWVWDNTPPSLLSPIPRLRSSKSGKASPPLLYMHASIPWSSVLYPMSPSPHFLSLSFSAQEIIRVHETKTGTEVGR